MKNFISLFITLGFLMIVSCNKKEESKIIIRPAGFNKKDTLTTFLKKYPEKVYELNKIRFTNKDTTFYLKDNLIKDEFKINFDNPDSIYRIDGIDSLTGKYSLWHINKRGVTFQSLLYKNNKYQYQLTLFVDFKTKDSIK